MDNVTLALALLLALGFVMAQAGRLLRLPSVTGYILAGLAMGPTGFGLITPHAMGGRLNHFTQIALMLIAFGIGEHLELRRLRRTAKKALGITLCEGGGSFAVVFCGSLLLTAVSATFSGHWSWGGHFLFSALLASISMATAPASTLHIIREEEAAGPLTTTLIQVVAINNSLAIMAFGITVAVARQTLDDAPLSSLTVIAAGFSEILLSLGTGIVTGILLDIVAQHLKNRGEMLTAGLALLLLCGEGARMLNLSPLLAGMAAGFTIVNRERRDVRLFRVLNAFEPPVYVLFFTLAGAHLDIHGFTAAGWVGLLYFCWRGGGKYLGARFGARLTDAPLAVRRFLGLALLPQAGVAIGLVFFLASDPSLKIYADFFTPVVLTGVFLAELLGPVATRHAFVAAGETIADISPTHPAQLKAASGTDTKVPRLVEWSWGTLVPPATTRGVVLFGASRAKTVAGLARMAVLCAHAIHARPLAVRVVPTDCNGDDCPIGHELFETEEAEAARMGYELSTAVIHADDVAEALVDTAGQAGARAIVLGHPGTTSQEMEKIVEKVAAKAPCPVLVMRFSGILHTERILVPFVKKEELHVLRDVLAALLAVGRHRLTLLRLMPSYCDEAYLEAVEEELLEWSQEEKLGPFVFCRVLATDSRLDTITAESENHDLIVMAALPSQGIQRLFFGSLAADVVLKSPKPLLMAYTGKNSPV